MKQWPNKHPQEVLDYQFDYADPTDPRLVTGETLTSSTWTLVEGDVVIMNNPAPSFAPSGLVTIWLSGGSAGTLNVLQNIVTTSAGRTYEVEAKLRVREPF